MAGADVDARVTPPPFARCETIAVGSELLALGRVDTNSAVIAERLASLGIDVIARSVVGDHLPHLELAVRTALQRADLVVLTGGLGPTDDDLTRQGVALALGRGMTEDPVQMSRIAERFTRRNLPMPAINRRQAMVIDGGVRLDNPNGTAPGQWIDVGDQAVVLLPGPPREMEPMLHTLVAGVLARRAGTERTFSKGLKVAGRSESAVESVLLPLYPDWRTATPPIDATILAAAGRIELHLFTRTADADAASVALDEAIARAAAALGPAVYTTQDESLEEVVGRLLHAIGWRVAVAESCTGGLLGARLTDVPGSSAWVDGGDRVQQRAAVRPGGRATSAHREARRRERARGAHAGGWHPRAMSDTGWCRHHGHCRSRRRQRRQARGHRVHRHPDAHGLGMPARALRRRSGCRAHAGRDGRAGHGAPCAHRARPRRPCALTARVAGPRS